MHMHIVCLAVTMPTIEVNGGLPLFSSRRLTILMMISSALIVPLMVSMWLSLLIIVSVTARVMLLSVIVSLMWSLICLLDITQKWMRTPARLLVMLLLIPYRITLVASIVFIGLMPSLSNCVLLLIVFWFQYLSLVIMLSDLASLLPYSSS